MIGGHRFRPGRFPLPSLAKGLGQSIKEFKKSSKDDEAEPVKPDEVKKSETVRHGTN